MGLEIGATAAAAHERAISHEVARGAQRRVPARARDVPLAGVGRPTTLRRREMIMRFGLILVRSLVFSSRFLLVTLPGAWLRAAILLVHFPLAWVFKVLATLHD